MKNIVATLAIAFSLAAGSAFAADHTLADRHVARGLECASCHKTAPAPGAVVKKDACKTCHNYDDLAKRTAKMQPNPHYTHLGDVNCVECHRGHQAPRLMCNDCHKFNITPK